MNEQEIKEYSDKVSLIAAWKTSFLVGLLGNRGFQVKVNFVEGDDVTNLFPTIIPGGEKIILSIPVYKQEPYLKIFTNKHFSDKHRFPFNMIASAILN